MSDTKTHWKKLTNPNYLGAWDIPENGSLTVTIKSVAKELVMGAGGEKDECIVARIEGQKPLILNKTNCKVIAKITGSNFIEDWGGRQITLITQKVRAFGDIVDAVRVKPIKAVAQLPELTPNSERWQGAIEALQTGKCDVAFIQRKFRISPENLEILKGQSC